HLTGALGANPLPVPPDLRVTAAEMADASMRFGLSKTSLFGLNAGAEYGPAKRWPAERFIQAAIEIQKQTGCRWLIFGGRADMELANQITQAIGIGVANLPGGNNSAPLNLAGKTLLRDLCALLRLCDLLLTN